MKKILLVAPDHVGIINVINEQLQGNKEYSIDYINLLLTKAEEFRYKNVGQRIRNFYLKKFTDRNLKHSHYGKQVSSKIRKAKKGYDVIVVIRPDLLCDDDLQFLRGITAHYVAYYWDSVSFYPRKLAIRHFFDRIFSFDQHDCNNYGFELLTNFYFFTEVPVERKYEVYGIVTYDSRKEQLEKIAVVLDNKGISHCIKAYIRIPFESNYIKHIAEVLDYRQMLKEISFSNVMVEIQKEGQGGLTFRPFEAMGMKKKMITNNPLIKGYDFYSAHNICVIDPENISIPDQFFSTPYQDIDKTITEKYHLLNWFNTLVSPVPVNFAE